MTNTTELSTVNSNIDPRPLIEPSTHTNESDSPTEQKDAQNSYGHAFARGIFFGSLFMTHISIAYILACLTTSTSDEEADRYNVLQETSISDTWLRTLASHIIYAASFGALTGLTQVVNQYYKKNTYNTYSLLNPTDEEKQASKISYKIYTAATRDGALAVTPAQEWGRFAAGFILFNAFNFYFCVPSYLAVGNEATPTLSKMNFSFLTPFVQPFNKHPGEVGFIMNLFLNYYMLPLKDAILQYNALALGRNFFPTLKQFSYKHVIPHVASTTSLTTVSTACFIALSTSAPDTLPNFFQITPLLWISSIVTYGALNSNGSASIVKYIIDYCNWWSKFPKPIIEYNRALSEYRGHVLGWLAWNTKHYFFELAFLLASDFLENLREAFENQNDIVVNHEPTIQEIQAELEFRIKSRAVTLDSEKALHDYIPKVRDDLIDKKRQETVSKATVWENGRVRTSIAVPFQLTGPAGLTIILAVYYHLLLEAGIVKNIQNMFPESDASANHADLRLIAITLFMPFITLVYTSGYSSMGKILKGTENIIANTANVIKNPSTYWNTVGFNEKTITFAINSFSFALGGFLLMIAGASSGTVIELISETPAITAVPVILGIADQVAYWFTGLFNSLGINSAKDSLKETVINTLYHQDVKPALEQSATFFKGLSCFGIKSLSEMSDLPSEEGNGTPSEEGSDTPYMLFA